MSATWAWGPPSGRGWPRGAPGAPRRWSFCDADDEYDPADLGGVGGPDPGRRGRLRGRGPLRPRPSRHAPPPLGRQPAPDPPDRVRGPAAAGRRPVRLPGLVPAAAAEAEIVHDYNYAQVLTLDLLAKGYRYAEIPIAYRHRRRGRSFIKPVGYLRRVVPAVYRELNQA